MSHISQALFPADTEKRSLFQGHIYKINPHAFDSNPNLMYPGKRLTIEFPRMEIGRVELLFGDVRAKDIYQESRVLKKGDSVYSGDLIETMHGSAKIRFLDDTFFRLRRRTEILIEMYRYSSVTDGNRKFKYKLLRGSIFATTGDIGKRPDDEYQLHTPTAILGIRGTEFGSYVCTADDCLLNDSARKGESYGKGDYFGVKQGGISVENETGTVELAEREFLHVESTTSTPQRIPPPRGFFSGSITRSSTSCWNSVTRTLAPCP